MDTGDSNEGAGSLPPKRLRLECIIHCSDDNTDKLVSLQNIDLRSFAHDMVYAVTGGQTKAQRQPERKAKM